MNDRTPSRTPVRLLAWLSGLVAFSLLLSACQSGPTAEEIVVRMKEVEASTQDAHAVVEFNLDLDIISKYPSMLGGGTMVNP